MVKKRFIRQLLITGIPSILVLIGVAIASIILDINLGLLTDCFWFLFCSGLLSAYLLLDDFFQFHEILAGNHVGISEKFTYMALGTAVLIYLFLFKRNIWQTNFCFLLMSFIFLATSVATDVCQGFLMRRIGHWQFFIEEGTKWLGISCWCSYYTETSYRIVVRAFFMR